MAPLSKKAEAARRKRGEELIEASFSGLHREVDRLIGAGADLEWVDKDGYTAISEAAMAGHTVVVGQLLRALADPNRPAQDGRTPLHRAAFHGWGNVVRLLLESGADPTRKDNGGALASDLAGSQVVREMLTSFPAERTRELQEDRRQKLAKRAASAPPVEEDEDEDEETQEAAPPPASLPDEQAGVPEGDVGAARFAPPPRVGAGAPPVSEKSVAAEKDQKYLEAVAELNARLGGGEIVSADIEPSPEGPRLTARARVSGASEDRLNGVYKVRHVAKEQVEFLKEGDEKCQIFWADWNDEWRMLIGDYKLGSVLYRHKKRPNTKADPCHGLPEAGWQKWFGKDPAPVVHHMAEGDSAEEAGDVSEQTATGEAAATGNKEASSTPTPLPETTSQKAEFIELHSRLEIIASDEGAARRAEEAHGGAGRSAQREVRLGHGGARIVETAEGLFGEDDVQVVEERGNEETGIDAYSAAAEAWLESVGEGCVVPSTWEAVQAAKAAAQELFAEGRISDARQATSAAIGALRQLAATAKDAGLPSAAADAAVGGAERPFTDDDTVLEVAGDAEEESAGGRLGGSLPDERELDLLLGTLHANRSLLVMQEIQADNKELLAMGADAAWRLIVKDTDAALRADAMNFKASFRRARAHFELGDLDAALVDANRVVDHYARHSSTPNPEAAALRESILEAVKKERGKWGQRGPARWNRAAPLVAEVSSTDIAEAERAAPASLVERPYARPPTIAATSPAPAPARPSSVVAARALAAPRTGGDVEKALLSTLARDEERQLDYLRTHLTPDVLRRLYRKAPLGPDLLATVVRLLARVAGSDSATAAGVLEAVAATPSAATHAAMFDVKEKNELRTLLRLVGPDVAPQFGPDRERPDLDGD